MNNQPAKTAKKGDPVRTYGWIMNWKTIRSADVKKLKIGEEYTIKTIFNRKVGTEVLPIYLGNILVHDTKTIEKRRFGTSPIPVFVSGKKKGERVYYNNHLHGVPDDLLVETSTRILYVFLNARELQVEIVDQIPPDILEKSGMIPPKMTFSEISSKKAEAIRRASRQRR